MKEFEFNFDKIFSGLAPGLHTSKQIPSLLECHNLVPIGNDYEVHSSVTDLNATGIIWGGSGSFITDIWEDHSDDDWVTDSDDEFEDH